MPMVGDHYDYAIPRALSYKMNSYEQSFWEHMAIEIENSETINLPWEIDLPLCDYNLQFLQEITDMFINKENTMYNIFAIIMKRYMEVNFHYFLK